MTLQTPLNQQMVIIRRLLLNLITINFPHAHYGHQFSLIIEHTAQCDENVEFSLQNCSSFQAFFFDRQKGL